MPAEALMEEEVLVAMVTKDINPVMSGWTVPKAR